MIVVIVRNEDKVGRYPGFDLKGINIDYLFSGNPER
jgi:hypothetical protein